MPSGRHYRNAGRTALPAADLLLILSGGLAGLQYTGLNPVAHRQLWLRTPKVGYICRGDAVLERPPVLGNKVGPQKVSSW
jgi:hypothetical protein